MASRCVVPLLVYLKNPVYYDTKRWHGGTRLDDIRSNFVKISFHKTQAAKNHPLRTFSWCHPPNTLPEAFVMVVLVVARSVAHGELGKKPQLSFHPSFICRRRQPVKKRRDPRKRSTPRRRQQQRREVFLFFASTLFSISTVLTLFRSFNSLIGQRNNTCFYYLQYRILLLKCCVRVQ